MVGEKLMSDQAITKLNQKYAAQEARHRNDLYKQQQSHVQETEQKELIHSKRIDGFNKDRSEEKRKINQSL